MCWRSVEMSWSIAPERNGGDEDDSSIDLDVNEYTHPPNEDDLDG